MKGLTANLKLMRYMGVDNFTHIYMYFMYIDNKILYIVNFIQYSIYETIKT